MKKIREWLLRGTFLCLLLTGLSAKAQPVYTNLHEFTGGVADGGLPGGLVSGGATFYGATAQGGTNGSGIIYAIGTNGGNFNVLHNFTGEPDGAFPNEPLVSGATLFSTTYQGGITNNFGSIFKIGTNGTGYTVLRQFTNFPDAQQPIAGLVLGGETLYGVSLGGGTTNSGTVFKIDTNGASFAILRHFTNSLDGSQPRGRLLLIGATLYGTTASGGSNGLGTVFKLNTNGSGYSVIYHFPGAPGAAIPWTGLVSDGNTLYGTTTGGGTAGAGTVFALGTNGGGFTLLHSLTNSEGLSPQGPLLLSGSTLYGTALVQGTGFGGILFQVQTNGAGFLVLKNFKSSTTGANPKGQVGLNGKNIFGINSAGSPGGSGSLYSLQLTPAITLQPQSLSVTNGAAVSFIGSGDGVGTLSYQWNSNSIPIAGATATNLNFASVTTNYAASYTLVVSNLYGSATSSPAILTVLAVPSISAQPSNLAQTNGGPATFTVAAFNGPLTYQWYFNTNTLLLNQTNTTLSIAGVTTNNAGTYTVIVANNIGSVTSTPALLTVIFAKPNITAQPQSLTVTNGNPATFTVTAINGTLSYQWYFNTNTLIAGQTNNSYTIPLVLTNHAGAYTVAVANENGAVTSSPAILTVSTNSKPVIYVQPQNLTVNAGDLALFSVTANGLGPLKYLWYTNSVGTSIGKPSPTRTNSFLTFTAGTNNNAYYFMVVISNSLGVVTSSPAALCTVIFAPVIVSNPQPATVYVGDPANFSVTTLGPTNRFQWYSNSVNTAIGTPLAGKTNSTYSFTSITNSNARYYSVVITNIFGRATSSPALLTVSSLPYITLQPLDTMLSNSSSITFTSTAAGPGPLGYQWLFQTNLWVASATNTTLVLSNSNPQGFYSMKVTNNFGAVTSSLAMFTIASLPVPTITLQPLSATITNGSSITFTSAATGTGTLGYQWLFQTNLLITGATGTSLTFLTANQPGAYSMKVTNSFGAATSTPALLTIVGKPLLLSSAFDSASGSYAFNYVNLAGSTNRLWTSTNLSSTNFWNVIATNFMATNGIWQVTDTNAAKTNAVKFYRFSTP